jgi:lantibiotic modifying enzyme
MLLQELNKPKTLGLKQDEILSKVIAIANELPYHNDDIGLYTGKTGRALFYSYLSKHLNTSDYNEQIEQLLVSVFEEINAGNIAPTFCSGLAGVIWTLNHLKNTNLLDIEDTFEGIQEILKEAASTHFNHANFDFMHGSDGIIFCLLEMNWADESLISRWLEQLYKHSEKSENGFVWETKLSEKNNKRIFNLGLSHGISSKIIVLAKTLECYPLNTLAKELLEGCVNYLIKAKNQDTTISYFPSYIDTDNTGLHHRLAWCYGDLGNAIALWQAGTIQKNEFWKGIAVDIMLLASKRKNSKDGNIVDAGFCHGTAGIAHFFNRFYLETGRNEFKEASQYWLTETMAYGTGPDGIAGFKKYTTEPGKEHIEEPGFLEGAAGIAMVLLGLLNTTKESIAWDACFLMN